MERVKAMRQPFRDSDPITSRLAAKDHAGRQLVRDKVLIAAASLTVFSDSMLTARLQRFGVDMDRSRVARRRKDLEEQGYVAAWPTVENQATRKGPSGRAQLVWQITKEGETRVRRLQKPLERNEPPEMG